MDATGLRFNVNSSNESLPGALHLLPPLVKMQRPIEESIVDQWLAEDAPLPSGMQVKHKNGPMHVDYPKGYILL